MSNALHKRRKAKTAPALEIDFNFYDHKYLEEKILTLGKIMLDAFSKLDLSSD